LQHLLTPRRKGGRKVPLPILGERSSPRPPPPPPPQPQPSYPAPHAAAGQARYTKVTKLQEETRQLSHERRTLQRQLREREGTVEDLNAQLRELQALLTAKSKEEEARSYNKTMTDEDNNNSYRSSESEDEEDYGMICGAAFASDEASAQVDAIRQLADAATRNRQAYKTERMKLDRIKSRLAESLDEVEDLNDELEEMEAGEYYMHVYTCRVVLPMRSLDLSIILVSNYIDIQYAHFTSTYIPTPPHTKPYIHLLQNTPSKSSKWRRRWTSSRTRLTT
jgi:hypothetical protein